MDLEPLPLPFFELGWFRVPVRLQPWVARIFVNKATSISGEYVFHRVPEVATHLAFSVESRSTAADDRSTVLDAKLVLSGAQARLYPVPFPVAEVLVFQLRPGAGRALGLPARALAGHIVDAEDVWGSWAREAADRMAQEASMEGRVRVLCELLEHRFLRLDPGGRLIRRAGALAVACAARLRTNEVAGDTGYSERQLRRVFAETFGLTPKDLFRVVRIKRLLQELDGMSGWADAAAQHGYHDQSHLIHEFRALLGETPERFVRTLAAPCLLGGETVVRACERPL